jgi:hypothetical protein
VGFDYAAAAETARKLIESFGSLSTINRFSDTPNVVAGSVARVVTKTQRLPAVILPASGGTLEAFDVRFMSDVKDSTDVRFSLVAAKGSTFQPEPKDEVTILGQVWQVMGCTPLNINGTPLIYSVGLKRP